VGQSYHANGNELLGTWDVENRLVGDYSGDITVDRRGCK
jgi:hypothetical protein